MSKNVTAKTVQITKPELVKCRASQEFQASVITFTKPNPPPPGMPKWFKAWSETTYQNQQPAWFKTWSETEFKPLKNDVSELKTDMSGVKKDISKLDTKLTRVIKLNTLQS